MAPAGFGPAIPARERPQTHALDSAATGFGTPTILPYNHKCVCVYTHTHTHTHTQSKVWFYDGVTFSNI